MNKNQTLVIDSVVDRLTQAISDATAPSRMTAGAAREVYERISSWCDASIEGLEDDAKD